MNNKYLVVHVAILMLTVGCGQQDAKQAPSESANSAEEQTSIVVRDDGMGFPATTSSDTAHQQYLAGFADLDNARPNTAHQEFISAAQTDPTFAMAHMMAAISGASSETFQSNLKKATASMDNASPAEKLMIVSMQQAFDGDTRGMVETRTEITKLLPNSSRAWVFLGRANAAENNSAQARAAFSQAVSLSPQFVVGHVALGNNLMTQEPKDFAQAEMHFKHAIAITPNEPNPYDLLGDVHRAQNNLAAAYDDYTKAAELAPELGSAYQQRGHVSSFLGNYNEARADYTRAAELEDARGSNNGGFFLIYRAFVPAHEGDLSAAVAQLRAIAANADGTYSEGVADLKINALSNAALFATEAGDAETANEVIAQAAVLMRAQAVELNSDKVKDAQEATIAYMEGILKARMGDSEGALTKAAEFEHYAESNNSALKLQRMHEILGMSAFYQDDFASAVDHLSAGNTQTNMYNKYYLALAHSNVGNADLAERIIAELAAYNFNGPGYAMFRKSILEKASAN
jgi:tetratricopeptide (TPR) repeat protein